jgi:hypothetical protein
MIIGQGITEFLDLVPDKVVMDFVCYNVNSLKSGKLGSPLAGPLEERMTIQMDELLGIVLPGERPEPCPHPACKNNRFHGYS